MKTLYINVMNRIATYSPRGGHIICGNSDYQVKFSFDPEWDAYSKKTARFVYNGEYTDVDFTGDTVSVPMIRRADHVQVGVYAGDLCTTAPANIPCSHSILCLTDTPTAENDKSWANEAKAAAERAAEDAREEVTRLVGEIGVVNAKGSSPTAAMSQKASTDNIDAILSAFETEGGYNLLDPNNAEEGYRIIENSALVDKSTPSAQRTITPISINGDTLYVSSNFPSNYEIGSAVLSIHYLDGEMSALKTSTVKISNLCGGAISTFPVPTGAQYFHANINAVLTNGYTFNNLCISTLNKGYEEYGAVKTPTALRKSFIPSSFLAQKIGNEEDTAISPKGVKNAVERIAVQRNLLTDAELVEGYYSSATNGTEATAKYNYFKDIVLETGTYMVTPRARFVADWTNKRDLISVVTPNATFTVEEKSVFRISVYSADSNFKLFSTEYEENEVEPIGSVTLNPNIKIAGVSTDYDYKNMLTGKKWYACGDSFTADGYGTSDQPKFTEGIYAGRNKVYPYFIGNRCGVNVYNIAAGGKTLAYVEGLNNCFADTQYTTIPEDADYITLYFGINDMHQSVPIGTADDTDKTTFCGAWNVVLEHLITNHPLAHIGIIVTNGTGTAYVEATKQMAIKWGIPYLDLATDNQVPLLLRTNRTDVCNKAKDLRLAAFRVSDTNSHPNADCHEYESYCIESWLMRL